MTRSLLLLLLLWVFHTCVSWFYFTGGLLGSSRLFSVFWPMSTIVTYSYADAYRNIFNTIKTSEHSSLEKYITHFIWKGSKGLRKVLLRERWVGDWTELQHIDPHSSGHSSISFPFSWAAQPGAWGPSLCWDMVLIPASSLQLIWTSCHRGYIIIWLPPTSCKRHICTQFNLSIVKVIPWSPDICSTGWTCYLHRWISHLTARPGRRSICYTIM